MENPFSRDCTAHSCEWSFIEDSQRTTCNEGSGDCIPFYLYELVQSPNNNIEIIELTKKIDMLVAEANLYPPQPGMKISLIIYEGKLFLQWINHSEVVPTGAKVVTGKDSPEAVARALGVKGLTAKKE